MTDSMMSKAATMEIPINSNGDTRTIAEDDGLEQVGSARVGLLSRRFYCLHTENEKREEIRFVCCVPAPSCQVLLCTSGNYHL